MYKKAQVHFKTADPKLYEASLAHKIDDIVASGDLFYDIVWTIIGQQLSGKAADTIFGRFKDLFPGGTFTPEQVLAMNVETMRTAGLSGAKARAVRDLAEKVLSREVMLEKLVGMTDADVLEHLMRVKGIGPWTAEMLLMFTLGRLDIFSAGDLGLQKGLMHLYGLKKLPGKKKLAQITGAWSPYRTYAARILWRVADAQKKVAVSSKKVAVSRKKA